MNNDYINIINIFEESERLPNDKYCLYPEKKYCRGKIKRAHTIQNNKILISVSDNGYLIALNCKSAIGFQ